MNLYYSKTSKSFLWGSELKSLMLNFKEKPPICTNALSLYFQLTYIPAPHTIYDGIYKLLPNHYLEIDVETLDYKVNKISKDKIALNKKSLLLLVASIPDHSTSEHKFLAIETESLIASITSSLVLRI